MKNCCRLSLCQRNGVEGIHKDRTQWCGMGTTLSIQQRVELEGWKSVLLSFNKVQAEPVMCKPAVQQRVCPETEWRSVCQTYCHCPTKKRVSLQLHRLKTLGVAVIPCLCTELTLVALLFNNEWCVEWMKALVSVLFYTEWMCKVKEWMKAFWCHCHFTLSKCKGAAAWVSFSFSSEQTESIMLGVIFIQQWPDPELQLGFVCLFVSLLNV